MKRINIKCPYCGSRALLRPASVVYGAKAADPNAPYYVCARYPAFDAYVAAHRGAHGHSGGWDAAPPAHPGPRGLEPPLGKRPHEQTAGVPLAPGQAGAAGGGDPYRKVFRIPLRAGHRSEERRVGKEC